MNRLSTRLIVSHALVALIAGATAYLLVRLLGPQLYDHSVSMMQGTQMANMMGPTPDTSVDGAGLRGVAVAAMNDALLIGALAGVATAALAGAWSATRILRPLAQVSAATRRMAKGKYDSPLELPREAELAAVAADVNALAQRLADTEKRRAQLLGEVAHEMRTPLTVLDGYVEGLLDGVFEPGPETLVELGTELRRLRRLADDLGSLSRTAEGGFDLRFDVVDLADLAARAAERLRPQFDDAGVGLRITVIDEPLRVLGDSDRLSQVVTNLVGNALTATASGGAVQLDARRDRADAVVAVIDTGVGLEGADVDRIFERFYRVHTGSRGWRRTGTGIGLTIARGIAVAHKGDLTAASPGRGQGSTFTLRIPRQRSTSSVAT